MLDFWSYIQTSYYNTIIIEIDPLLMRPFKIQILYRHLLPALKDKTLDNKEFKSSNL